MKTKHPDLVLIVWIDAAHEFGWVDEPTATDKKLSYCYTIGWLMPSVKGQVKVCQTYSDDERAQTLTIPAGMITSIRKIKP
jgi:hypothetical protein